MSTSIDELTERGMALGDQLRELHDKYGTDENLWPAGVRTRAENLSRGLKAIDADITAREAQTNRTEWLRHKVENGEAILEHGAGDPVTRRRSDPWAGLGDTLLGESPTGFRARALDAIELVPGIPTENRQRLSEMIDSDATSRSAIFTVAAADPAYRAAFDKVLRNPIQGHLEWTPAERESFARVQNMRAALSLTDANGGYLVPFTLDPTAVLTNVGSSNPFRRICRIEQTATEDWNGTTSPGISAEWAAESAEASDASPTFGRVTIRPERLSAFVQGSYEILQDSNFVEQLPRLLADAFANAEAAGFATGAGHGSTEPEGVVTVVAATTASVVAPTTASAFGLPDIYKVHNALPARSRSSASMAWVANNTVINLIRQMDTAGSAAFWTDLNGPQPATLLGSPIYESSVMSAAVTTGSSILLAGSFEDYCVVDRLGTTLVYQPMVMGENGRASGEAAWFAYRRVSGGVLNAGSFRILTL